MILSFKQFVAEEIANIPKWWYNTKTRKAVKVFRDFHIQQVFTSGNISTTYLPLHSRPARGGIIRRLITATPDLNDNW